MPRCNVNPARNDFPTGILAHRRAWQLTAFAVCVGAALVSAGCIRRTVHAAWNLSAAASASRPHLPAKRPAASNAKLDAPPNLKIAAPEVIALPVVARTAPARPHNGMGPAQTGETEAADPRPTTPQLSPRMSPQEQAAAEKQTRADIGAAERNLRSALGRQLNPTQSDLVEKIRGFLRQAREAIRDSDWLRAKNLAQKAQVLSAELINSL
ncbi:MAG TPA: hypothetical protein VK156_04785 [Candidatus Limnocylindria bacterium]|nr:hypothetical protein [Candidatus Limnocylindria bacterium]